MYMRVTICVRITRVVPICTVSPHYISTRYRIYLHSSSDEIFSTAEPNFKGLSRLQRSKSRFANSASIYNTRTRTHAHTQIYRVYPTPFAILERFVSRAYIHTIPYVTFTPMRFSSRTPLRRRRRRHYHPCRLHCYTMSIKLTAFIAWEDRVKYITANKSLNPGRI